ncbi:uncharacterized protein CC84DRAFT_1213638 [Paraphaeosphaeria sporulosa]|uniref:Uncharacterized protein n=1 Tax=Paraphaeosphaeria sporulosa TaxID=1460663 RepID=A0A177CSM4_9PLEO|nr:uncharacterized protein CC84DRAFT_1213638 [Paraphaeosphaeria sporulosa]OAG10296.1 hypothetical protein CC84DRAFT_1213638 [Paraphaeosphaeria sporulosa]
MAPTALIVRSATIFSSVLLIALSITVLSTSVDASNRIAKDFPAGEYGVWYGPVNAVWKGTNSSLEFLEKKVNLDYDYATEQAAWAAASICLIVGLLSVGFEVTRLLRSRKNGDTANTSKALSITAIALSTVTFIVSLAALVFVNVHPKQIEETSCDWEGTADRSYGLFKPGRDSYTCTREQSACKVIYYAIQDVLPKEMQCVELQIARHTMIPLFIFSGLVTLGYGAQMWVAKKERYGGVDPEERVRRLQEEDEE